MPNRPPSPAELAYQAAAIARHRSVLRDVDQVEHVITDAADLAYSAIMRDARAGTLSTESAARAVGEFFDRSEEFIGHALEGLSRDWWFSCLSCWEAACEKTPKLLAALAYQPALVESGSILATLATIFDPPSRTAVLAIVNRPVKGLTWRERIKTARAEGVSAAKLAEAVARSYAAGGNLDEIAEAISPLLAAPAARARMIARTEGLRVANDLHERSMEQAGDVVIGFTYVATLDDVTRPAHAARNGRVFKKDDQERPELPDGPNCVLPGSVVSGRIIAIMRAWYEGPAYTITLANGSTLSVTAHHGVLTPTGFVGANAIREGDDLIGHLPNVDRSLRVADHQYRPPAVEEVFASLGPSTVYREARPTDLHGDGRHCQGDIEVVWADGKLLLDRDSSPEEFGREGVLCGAGVEASAVAGSGPHQLHRLPIDLTAAGGVRGGDLIGSSLAGDRFPLGGLRLGPAAEFDAVCLEARPEGYPRDTEFVGELLKAGSGSVAPSRVVKIERRAFAGHVYDLQCEGGWYTGNGIVSKNCRCIYTPILDTDVKVFGRPGSIPPEARHVEAFAGWFDQQSRARRVAIVGEAAYAKAEAAAKGGAPSWQDVANASPTIETERIRGTLEEKTAAVKARRSAA